LLFSAEVIPDQRMIDAGIGGDVPDTQIRIALADKPPAGRVQDQRAGTGPVAAARGGRAHSLAFAQRANGPWLSLNGWFIHLFNLGRRVGTCQALRHFIRCILCRMKK
jgi:hypothetical protein